MEETPRARLREPLRERDIPTPEPSADQIRVRVRACAVCRTDLHIVDGELPRPKLPLVLGRHVLPYFNDRPGVHIGEVTNAAYEAQADGGFSTEGEAMRWLKMYMEARGSARAEPAHPGEGGCPRRSGRPRRW